MLWNKGNNSIIFIDLKRAIEIRRIALQELPVSRKRKRSFPGAKTDFKIKAEDRGGETEAVLERAEDGSEILTGVLY